MARKAKQAVPYSVPQPVYQQHSQVMNLPPPVGGWNARDPLAQMPATDAVVMDNLIPGNGSVSIRNGYTSWATGLGSSIESLMEYSSPTGNQLFAAVPTDIYEVTSAGPVGAAKVSSLTNGRFQHTMFATAAGNYLVACNGADSVLNFDGSSWTNPTINNVTSANLIHVNTHANRLWFVEKNSLSAWYLPVESISGDATELPLGSYASLGGYLMAMGSWSQDGGDGLNDLAVFVTSAGQAIVYRGTDPSSASTWTQVGVYRVPPPIGRRCLIKTGSELGILTAVGLVPMSRIISLPFSSQQTVAVTDKINGAFRDYYLRGSSFFGWQVIEYPKLSLMIVNAPVEERTTQHQFVMNSRTGAWCRFTSMNAGCWSTLGDDLFFGDNDGTVWKYSSEYADDASTITALLQQAFSDLGTVQNKRVVATRPVVIGPSAFSPTITIKTDYDTSEPSAAISAAASDVSLWNVSTWNVALWKAASVPSANWQSATGIGKAISVVMNFAVQQEFSMNGMDVMFEPGGYF